METNPMRGLYANLAALGLSEKYVRSILLPAWWEDEAADTEAGYSEALLLVARHAGLDVASLRAGKPRPSEVAPSKLKEMRGTSDEELAAVRMLATQVARLGALGAPPLRLLPGTAQEIRDAILEQGGVVDLESLTGFCWSVGIPVLHMSAFPPKIKRMQGLAALVKGRPVIVLALQRRQPAWLLFVLAHELGHIALGHMVGDQVLLDEDVDQNDRDPEENAANRFGIDLLAGAPDARFPFEGRWPNAAALAMQARRLGAEMRIDPGHVVLNYAHSMGPSFFSVANAALKILDPEPDGPAVLRRALADWSVLPEESSEFLARITSSGASAGDPHEGVESGAPATL